MNTAAAITATATPIPIIRLDETLGAEIPDVTL